MTAALIHTARIAYPGPFRLDITRKGESPFGPSWGLLNPYKAKDQAGTLTADDWPNYVVAYKAELRVLWRRNRAAWVDLAKAVERDGAVVLCCYCTNPEQCHRTVLAEILLLVLPELGVPCVLGEPAELMPRSAGFVCYRGKKRGCEPLVMWDEPKVVQT